MLLTTDDESPRVCPAGLPYYPSLKIALQRRALSDVAATDAPVPVIKRACGSGRNPSQNRQSDESREDNLHGLSPRFVIVEIGVHHPFKRCGGFCTYEKSFSRIRYE